MVSSDWSECLSPNGPFDPLSFAYPGMRDEFGRIFKDYTSNSISLSHAAERILGSLPAPLTAEQMDQYLDARFATYTGVPDLMKWCLDNDILFMVNTTGTQAYFQRVFAKGLLPRLPALAANPMIAFESRGDANQRWCEIREIEDKPVCTESVADSFGIPRSKIVIMGDSGGDGAHFAWGGSQGCSLIASMPKASLEEYCAASGTTINHRFGVTYEANQQRDREAELQVDFMELCHIIEQAVA
jgi:2-hydroxy-3-keto-5-methylthiopentenyl-1-phosphate phosphatase